MSDIDELEGENQMAYISSFERRDVERGRAIGRQEGMAEIVGLLLEKRFHPVPLSIVERVMKGTPADLSIWAFDLLDAPTLDAVFARK